MMTSSKAVSKSASKSILLCSSAVAAALLVSAAPAFAQATQGPSSSATPYVLPTAPYGKSISIFSAGDSVNLKPDGTPYRMVGIPDGLGAFDNGNGTFTVLMNHELGATSGIARAHGQKGAFVSKWIIDKSTLGVSNGSDLIQSVVTGGSSAFGRFCSADLAAQTAFYDAASGLGAQNKIFLSGEENGQEGRVIGTSVSTGVAYDLTSLGKFSAENALANPFAQQKTVVIGNDDSTPGQLQVYIGQKQSTGTDVQKAGLVGGSLYGLRVSGVLAESRTTGIGAPTKRFDLASLGDVSTKTGAQLDALNAANSVTTFLRPEDGAWNPSNANEYYWVTTDQFDQVKDGTGSQIGRSRLWRATFDNIADPTLGGKVDVMLDGTRAGNMFDNITVVPGVDGKTRILLQEDVGSNAHNGKIYLYEPDTGALTEVARHDTARFGDIGVAATVTNDEEASGIIDAQAILGPGWFLTSDQAHNSISGELAEGGQLLALYIPQAVGLPEPTTLAAFGGLAMMAIKRRRA